MNRRRGHKRSASIAIVLLASVMFASLPACRAEDSLAPIIRESNKAGLHLLAATARAKPGSNALVSPVATTAAYLLLAQGAAGTTRRSINERLQLPNQGSEEPAAAFLKLTSSLRSQTPESEVAAAVIAGSKIKLQPAFVQLVNQTLKGEALQASAPDAVQRLSSFISNQTHGAVKNVSVSPPAAGLMLLATAYFDGTWADQFQVETTRKIPFNQIGGKSSKASMMHKKFQNPIKHLRTPTFEAVRLPYDDGDPTTRTKNLQDGKPDTSPPKRFDMYFFLPNKDIDFYSFCDTIAQTGIDQYIPKFEDNIGDLALPRFAIDAELPLPLPLPPGTAHGALDMSNMVTRGTQIVGIDAQQQLHIEVNEKGTRAAAVTEVIMWAAVMEGFDLRFNRPFLFMLKDNKSGAILFAGAVVDPQDNKDTSKLVEQKLIQDVEIAKKHYLTTKPREDGYRLGESEYMFSLLKLARFYEKEDLLDKMTKVYEEASKLPDTLNDQEEILFGLAREYMRADRLADAETVYVRLLAILKKGYDQYDYATALSNYATLLKRANKPYQQAADEAEKLLRADVEELEKSQPSTGNSLPLKYLSLAEFYKTFDRMEDAAAYYKKALPGLEDDQTNNGLAYEAGKDYIELLIKLNRPQEADALKPQLKKWAEKAGVKLDENEPANE